MNKYVIYLAIVCFLFAQTALAQADTVGTSASIRVVTLPDVEITGSLKRLVVASGKEDNNHVHSIGPGGGNAIRFLAPQAEYHELRQIRLHIRRLNQLREGQVQIRIASVTDSGEPADNNLLPTPLILTTADLNRAHRSLTIQWPAAQLLVPKQGFFIIIEGLGKTVDEYVSGVVSPEKNKKSIQYKISNRNQPEVVVRTVEVFELPRFKGTKPDSAGIDSWYRDTVTRQWHRNRPGKSVILVEAIFE